jgi:FMN reductase
MNVVVVAGNPKPGSRTLSAASMVAEAVTGTPPDAVLDVITLGDGLLGFGNPDVLSAIESVRAANVAVIASPTFKASYSGVLKAFLDQIPADGLAGVTAVPLMLGAGPGHALAPELLLKPVLAELGANCPTRGLYLLDSIWDSDPALHSWLPAARRQVMQTSSSVR